MAIYRTCKASIERKLYKSKEDMQTKLDTFFMLGKLTSDEYQELTIMLGGQE